jgi:Arc/MetJ family transcription regulator
MRTNIVIDDELMKQALTLSGLKTKREAVEEGLRLLIVMKKQAKIRELRGALSWEGDLDAMRSDACSWWIPRCGSTMCMGSILSRLKSSTKH